MTVASANAPKYRIRLAVNEIMDQVVPPELGPDVVVKINAMSDELYPGRNTSPLVLDAVLREMRTRYSGIQQLVVADCDTAGHRQFWRACEVWGYDDIAERHGATLCNLSEMPTYSVDGLELALIPCSHIVNVPVLKTHVITGMSCALKNLWGFMPRARYQHHPRALDTIERVNRAIQNVALTVVDATVCMEGDGPKVGTPKVCNMVFAGQDRWEVDDAMRTFMLQERFARPTERGDVVSWLERSIHDVAGWAYAPGIARVLGAAGVAYNRAWLQTVGKLRMREALRGTDYERGFQ